MKPVAITLEEINKGFAGSRFDAARRVYHLRYQEAGEQLLLDVPLPPVRAVTRALQPIIYHTGEELRHTAEGLPYTAWLTVGKSAVIPVPGRGSYDPFGRRGSAHAGEVVGYGCSMHHAGLVVAMTELASLGAERRELTQVKNAMMAVHGGIHQRNDLADYQMEQVLAAFTEQKTLTLAEYLQKHPQPSDAERPHLARYAQPGVQDNAWAETRVEALCERHPELYPKEGGERLNPRSSWYDGRDARLPDGKMQWCNIQPAHAVARI